MYVTRTNVDRQYTHTIERKFIQNIGGKFIQTIYVWRKSYGRQLIHTRYPIYPLSDITSTDIELPTVEFNIAH